MLELYKQTSKNSLELWNRALDLFPGGVCHNLRTFGLDKCEAYPPFMKKGEGSHLWDVDGREYVDWWMTHFSLILGHNDPSVKEAIQSQLINGHHFGALTEPQVVFGEKLRDAIPYMAKMRFTSTGSEATMYAARLARSFTRKRLIAKARGGWHGGNDTLAYHIAHPYTDKAFYDGVSFEFNDRESVDTLLKNHGNQLAAIMVEPVLGAGGGLAPEADFLPYLREETEARDIILIFDEIITGFRLCFGSTGKKIFGVEPDLITLGKIAAGGMPLGVYGGREDIMAIASPDTKGGPWVGGGTFSSHPLTMVAGVATLDKLKSLTNKYESINDQGNEFREEINNVFENKKVPALATGIGSIIFIHWFHKVITEPFFTGSKINEALDLNRSNLFQGMLLEQGIFGYHGLGALSFSHSEEDLRRTLDGISKVVSVI